MPSDDIYTEYFEDKDYKTIERYGTSIVNSMGLLFSGPLAFNARSKKKYRYAFGLNYITTSFYAENASHISERESGNLVARGSITRYSYKVSYLGIPLQVTRTFEKRTSAFEIGLRLTGNFLINQELRAVDMGSGELLGTKPWDYRSQSIRDYWLSTAVIAKYSYRFTKHFGAAASLSLGATPMNLIKFDEAQYDNMRINWQQFDTWEKSRTLNPFASGGLEVFYTW